MEMNPRIMMNADDVVSERRFGTKRWRQISFSIA